MVIIAVFTPAMSDVASNRYVVVTRVWRLNSSVCSVARGMVRGPW